jgi:hypothetical protein
MSINQVSLSTRAAASALACDVSLSAFLEGASDARSVAKASASVANAAAEACPPAGVAVAASKAAESL